MGYEVVKRYAVSWPDGVSEAEKTAAFEIAQEMAFSYLRSTGATVEVTDQPPPDAVKRLAGIAPSDEPEDADTPEAGTLMVLAKHNNNLHSAIAETFSRAHEALHKLVLTFVLVTKLTEIGKTDERSELFHKAANETAGRLSNLSKGICTVHMLTKVTGVPGKEMATPADIAVLKAADADSDDVAQRAQYSHGSDSIN